jgi:hypothetical protein
MTDFKQPYPKHNPFHCSADWHLVKSAQAMAIYNLAGRVTHGGEEGRLFFGRPKAIAQHFGFSYDSVLRALKILRATGWLIRPPGHRSIDHIWVDHKTWSEQHPGQCIKRELLPWQETMATHDPLVARLYAASKGQLRLRENVVVGIHKLNDDDRFVEMYVKELAAAAAKRQRGDWSQTSNESCLWRVYRYLKARKKTQAAAEGNVSLVESAK